MPLKLLCSADPADSHHLRHIELLAGAGVEVHLVDYATDFAPGGTPARSHRAWPKSGRRTLVRLLGRRLGGALADRLLRRQLRAIWKREGTQVCHTHWISARLLAAAQAGLKPLVATAYGTDLNATREPDYDPRQLDHIRRGLAEVDLLIADSADMVAIAEDLAGRRLRSMLLPIGVDTGLFRPGYEAQAAAWRAELDIPAGARVVLSPRVVRPNYRQVELVRAFARAVNDHGLDGYMIFKTFVGEPAYVEEVRAAAQAAGVGGRIRVIEAVDYERLPVLYAMSDLAVSFPLQDAFPVTFLEAGACELPMLTNHRPAYESNGMAPFLAFMDAEDEAAIGAQVARLCGDPATLEQARAARRHIVANFDETAFVRALVGAYDSLLP